MLTCLIVDDEIMARKSLQRFCEKSDNLNLVQVFENAKDALEFLVDQSVDLIFLDIEMPEISGIDFLNQASTLPCLLYTSPSPRDRTRSRMPSSA